MSSLGVELDPCRCALLVIDMQNDFVSPGGYHHRQGKPMGPMQAIIPNIQLLLDQFPASIKRVFIATAREPDGSDSHWRFHRILPERVRASRETEGSDRNALRGTWGAEMVSLLQPGPGDHIVYKRRYSAFYQTDLEMRLRCWGVDTLFFAGCATEICVESTLRDAFMRDFDVVLMSDAIASWDAAAHQATISVVRKSLGAVLSVEEAKNITWL